MNNSISVKIPLIFKIIFLSIIGFLFLPTSVHAEGDAALFLNPASGTFLVGSTFNLSVILDTKGNSINTIEVDISFPPDKIQLANPSVGQSVIQLWPAPPSFSNREGRIYFVGGIPSPGIVTSDGVVLTLTFRVISPGEAQISFGDQTSILANDGLGTNILKQKPPAFFKFLVPPPKGPAISSPTHPDQERWYRDNNPVFIWQKSSFATGFSYLIDHDPSGFPGTVSKGLESTASFQSLDNGIWYFHLREKADSTWGGVSTYVVKVDNEAPAAFTLDVSPGERTTNRSPIFRFFTTDALSGFSHFEMKMINLSQGNASDALFYEVSSPYQVTNIATGRYQVVVRAYDNAGNTRDETVTLSIVGAFSQFIGPDGIDLVIFFMPWSVLINLLFILLVIFLIVIFYLWRKHKHHINHAFVEDIRNLFINISGISKKIKGKWRIIFIAVSVGLVLIMPHSVSARSGGPLAPIISVVPAQYYPLDEILYIEGQSIPKAKIAVNFEKPDASPVTVIVDSNSNGEWFLGQKVELSSGEWTVRAKVLGDPASDWSNPRIIESVVSGFILGNIKIKYLPIAITLTLLLLVSVSLLIYLLLRVAKIRRSEHLRQDISDELGHLEKAIKEGKKLSDKEEKRREELLIEFRHAQEVISEKFKDVK